MAHSQFTSEEIIPLKKEIISVVRSSIVYGMENNSIGNINTKEFPEVLRQKGSCFVTLTISGELRGCIGSFGAQKDLIEDIYTNAYRGAFEDTRFLPLTPNEFEKIHIEVSILSPMKELPFDDEQDLLSKLKPNIDGLYLEDGGRGATFLPSVWEQLPEPKDFLVHLKQKMGRAPDYWSKNMRASIYHSIKVSE